MVVRIELTVGVHKEPHVIEFLQELVRLLGKASLAIVGGRFKKAP